MLLSAFLAPPSTNISKSGEGREGGGSRPSTRKKSSCFCFKGDTPSSSFPTRYPEPRTPPELRNVCLLTTVCRDLEKGRVPTQPPVKGHFCFEGKYRRVLLPGALTPSDAPTDYKFAKKLNSPSLLWGHRGVPRGVLAEAYHPSKTEQEKRTHSVHVGMMLGVASLTDFPVRPTTATFFFF